MNTLSIKERVTYFKEKFKAFAQHPEHTCVATEVSASEIKRLQSIEGDRRLKNWSKLSERI